MLLMISIGTTQSQNFPLNSTFDFYVDSCAFSINGEIMKHSFIIDLDSIIQLNIVKDTLVVIDNKKYDKYLSITYKRSPVTLIPIEQVDHTIQTKYKDFHYVFMVDDVFIKKSPSDFLIDKDYIKEVKLIKYKGFTSKRKNPKILIIGIYTKDRQKKMLIQKIN